MNYSTRQQAINLYTHGLNVPTIAVLLGIDRDEIEVAIEDAEAHSLVHLTGDDDDWRGYEAN